jgi:four helix bundle protein
MLPGKECGMTSEPTANPPIRSYRDLRVWQRATDLVEDLYRITASFPVTERYGLAAQLRRAGISVASNIAEGHTRSRADYRRFLVIAAGSLTEIECQLLISVRLTLIESPPADAILERCRELGRMLSALRNSLSGRHPRSQAPGPRP